MTQIEFLDNLQSYLNPLPSDERDRIIEYYSEIISDKIEDGNTEENAISELESPDKIAQRVLEDYSDAVAPSKKIKSRSAGKITGFSALAPFVILMFAILVILALSFIITAFSLTAGGLVYMVCSFVIFSQGFAAGLFQLGFGLGVTALGIFASFGAIQFVKLCLFIFKTTVKKYISVYGGVKNETA